MSATTLPIGGSKRGRGPPTESRRARMDGLVANDGSEVVSCAATEARGTSPRVVALIAGLGERLLSLGARLGCRFQYDFANHVARRRNQARRL